MPTAGIRDPNLGLALRSSSRQQLWLASSKRKERNNVSYERYRLPSLI